MPTIQKIPMDRINEPEHAARLQMDSEKFAALKASLANPKIGLLYPPIVFPVAENRYEIEDGHRRFLAARELGWYELTCNVYECAELAHEAVKVHANLHEEMSAADEAAWYCELMEGGRTIDEVCELTQQKYNYVSDRVNLLQRGDAEIFKAMAEGVLGFTVARELNKIRDESLRRYYLEFAKNGGCTYATAKLWVAQANMQQQSAPAAVEQVAENSPAPMMQTACCAMCGGDKDPYNLVNKLLHWFCWDRVEKALQGEQ